MSTAPFNLNERVFHIDGRGGYIVEFHSADFALVMWDNAQESCAESVLNLRRTEVQKPSISKVVEMPHPPQESWRDSFFAKIALPMVEMGVPVIRLAFHNKKPADNGWQNLATTDINVVKAWAEETPACNCGSVAKDDGVVFFETDEQGVVERFEKETGQKFPLTYAVRSRKDRYHFYYKQSDASRALGNVKQGPGGISFGSVRQHNEFVVSPGSIHPETGEPYTTIRNVPMIPFPEILADWLKKQIVRQPNQTGTASNTNTNGEHTLIPHGQFHAALVSEAGRLRKYGYEPDAIEEALLAWGETHCEGGIDAQGRKRIHQYAQSMKNYKPDDPRLNYLAKIEPDIDIIPANTEIPEGVEEEKESMEYPYWAWNGTLYEEFATLCGEKNLVPKEYFLEAIKTTVGAICGHRITPYQNPTQESRFYTVLMGPAGCGKTSAVNWSLQLFAGTGLIYDLVQQSSFMNVGCAKGRFASSSGMAKNGFLKHDRILQVYDEASTLIEKFGIPGSGDAFLDDINTLFESSHFSLACTKDSKEDIERPVHNSILGCTTKEKWGSAFMKTNTESSGFFPRLNLITTECEDRVADWVEPDLSVLRDRFVRKIQPLEYQVVIVHKTPEATEKLEEWFKSKRDEWRDLSDDVTGRLQVLVHRNASHLAWLLSGDDVVPNPETKDPIEVTCDEDIMERAIALADYEQYQRSSHQPPHGKTDQAVMENLIKERVKAYVQITRKLLYDKVHAERYGIQTFDRAISNLTQEGFVRLAKKEGEKKRGRKALILEWVGAEE